MPEGQPTRDRCAGRRDQRAVQPIDVKGQVNRAFQGLQRLDEGGPCRLPSAWGHDVAGKPCRDTLIGIDALLFFKAVRPNTDLEQAPNTKVQGTRSRTGMRVRLAVKFTSEIGMCIDLHHGQAPQIALHRRVVPYGSEHGRKDAVFTAKGQREHVTGAPGPQESFHLIELFEK